MCKNLIHAVQAHCPELNATYCYELMLTALNGGLPLDLLGHVGIDKAQFEEKLINFSDYAKEDLAEAQSTFATAVNIFSKNNTLNSDSEFNFCNSSWYSMLQSGYEHTQFPVVFEWKPKAAFGLNDYRRIDAAVLIKMGNSPVLLIESALEVCSPGNLHKDYAKLLAAMTICCRFLAKELLSAGKDQLVARCIGMLIGGRGVQLCLAYPQLRIVNGSSEWHICIDKKDDWYIDLVSGPAFSASTSSLKASTASLFIDNVHPSINDQSLKAMLFLFKEINKAAESIRNAAPSNYPSKPNDFSGSRGLVPGCTSGMDRPTLSKYHFELATKSRAKKRKDPPSMDRLVFNIKKPYMQVEIELGKLLCSEYPILYPSLLDSTVDEEKTRVRYVFERMYPARDQYGSLNLEILSPFAKNSAVRFLQDAIEFTLSIALSLHLLHTDFKCVHSDVSPNNVMYSWRHQCWKLIDYEQAAPIDQSIKSIRDGGTDNFRAPEAALTGIFTPECDVFAFGKTLSWIFTRFLQQLKFTEPVHVKWSGIVCDLAGLMARFDRNARPSLLITIKLMLDALESFELLDGSEQVPLLAKEVLEEEESAVPSVDDCFKWLEAATKQVSEATSIDEDEKKHVKTTPETDSKDPLPNVK